MRRYCGDVEIELRWRPGIKKFSAAIIYDKGQRTVLLNPEGPVDDDAVAHKALMQALEEYPDVADAAASGIENGRYVLRRQR